MEIILSHEVRDCKLKPNILKIVTTILSRLENRLILLRNSLSEAKGTGNLKEKLGSKISESFMDEGNQLTVDPTTVEYTLVFDCCDIEAAVHRILNELVESGTFLTLNAVVREYGEAGESFKKHQKILELKRHSIAERKQQLASLREKHEPLQHVYETIPRKDPELSEANLSLVKQWMECKIESKKEYYEYRIGKIRRKTENFKSEARMHIHTDFQMASFWLLKYESFVQDLDLLLRKIYDEWASKKREISVLKKYREFNLEKIKKITDKIAHRKEVIQTDRKEKELEKKREIEELRRHKAATLIQAHWRGTMVRKHLGPYKIKKKKKKGKKGKKKGKK